MHEVSNSEAFYYHHTAESCVISGKVTGENRKAVKLTTKVLPRVAHYAEAANGASKKIHGGKTSYKEE